MDPARERALEVLLRWEREGASLDLLYQRMVEGEGGLSRRQRAFGRELVFGTVRWLRTIDWYLEKLIGKSPKDLSPLLRNALRIGVYQLFFLDRVPPWAAVSETVELVKAREGAKAAGFVNGVLRNFLRQRAVLRPSAEDPVEDLSLRYSFPRWIVRRFLFTFGPEETVALLEALNKVPPFTIRVNTLKTTREELLRVLQPFAPRPTPFSPWGIILERPQGVLDSEAFQEGLFQVQDEGAQLVTWLLGPKPGERVLDLCAAPGGKTTHLAELMGDKGEVLAVDVNPSRIKTIEANAQRLGITIIRTLRHDATRPLPERGFDKALADVPCSGLGVLRRNPDIKWRLTPREVQRLSAIQRRILENALRVLKPGGLLLYSTCTLTQEENWGVVREALGGKAELIELRGVVPLRDDFFDEKGYFLSLPSRHGTDGFFCALLRRL